MRRKSLLFIIAILMVCAVVAVTGCGESESGQGRKEEQPATTTETQAQIGPDGKPVKTIADFPNDTDGAEVEAVIKTDKGEIVLTFFADAAPVTVANFLNLARSGFYSDVKFHRVVPGFVVQGGDPLSKDDDPSNDGTGGPGYYLPAEFNQNLHKKGALAMARSQDPNSGGSQFYICLDDQPNLDGQYTVFGQLVSGMEVVEAITQGDVIREIVIRPKSTQ